MQDVAKNVTQADPRAAAAAAITWLFVPGDRPDRFAKAAGSGADEIILDLEDAVAPTDKATARQHIGDWLRQGGSGWVRINAADTAWFEADLAELAAAAGLRGVMVPKAEETAPLERVRRAVTQHAGLVALVESARGVAAAADLAGCPAVDRLAFGSVDFAVDLDAVEEWDSLLLARSGLVLASRAAGKPGPIDGVTRSIDDTALVGREAARSRRLGFSGKLAIHPAQLPAIAAAFRPEPAEIEWARSLVAAVEQGSSGALAVDGQMIDKPVLDRAHALLRRAGGSPGAGASTALEGS